MSIALRRQLLSIALWTSTITATANASALYTIEALGPTDGSVMTWATAMNEQGQVVGYVGNGNDYGGYNAVLFSGTVAADIGAGPASQATSINDQGQIVGWTRGVTFGTDNAFLSDGNTSSVISTARSVPYAINNAGNIVGYLQPDSYTTPYGYIYQDGAITNISTTTGQTTIPYAINNAGTIVGAMIDQITYQNRAFVYNEQGFVDIHDLIGLGAYHTVATGINDSGAIIGNYYTPENGDWNRNGFLIQGGVTYSLGSLSTTIQMNGTTALDINDAGMVVGSSPVDSGALHAIIFNSGQLLDLNDLFVPTEGWTVLNSAVSINNGGQIAGVGAFNGHSQAFLLTPVQVSEPATVVILFLGFGQLIMITTRRARARRAPNGM